MLGSPTSSHGDSFGKRNVSFNMADHPSAAESRALQVTSSNTMNSKYQPSVAPSVMSELFHLCILKKTLERLDDDGELMRYAKKAYIEERDTEFLLRLVDGLIG